jgi:hypothetical protein
MERSTRRDVLKVTTGIGFTTTFCSNLGSAYSGPLQVNTDGVYVWRPAIDILERDSSRTEFYDIMADAGATTAYFSWGAYEASSATATDLEQFVLESESNGIDVELMAGPTPGQDAPAEFSNDYVPAMLSYLDSYADPAGIHLDIEPSDGSLDSFLYKYESVLSDIEAKNTLNGVHVSVAWRDWWTQSAMSDTKNVRDHGRADSVVVMAYEDTESEIRTSIKDAMQDGTNFWGSRTYSSQNYVTAVEIQDPDGKSLYPENTLYDEDEDATASILDALDSDPTPGNYQGNAIHDYHALRNWANTSES